MTVYRLVVIHSCVSKPLVDMKNEILSLPWFTRYLTILILKLHVLNLPAVDFRSAYVTQFSINTNRDDFIKYLSLMALQFIVGLGRDLRTLKSAVLRVNSFLMREGQWYRTWERLALTFFTRLLDCSGDSFIFSFFNIYLKTRYYTAVRRYELYLRVMNERSE